MIHPNTTQTDQWRNRVYNEQRQNSNAAYLHTHIKPSLPPHIASRLNFDNIPPSLLQPRQLAPSLATRDERVLGIGGVDRDATMRVAIATAPASLHSNNGTLNVYAPLSPRHLQQIMTYGHTADNPYNSADFPPSLGITDVKRNRRFEGHDASPLQWDPHLDQTSSKQFRSKEEQGKVFRSHLHPPVRSRPSTVNAPVDEIAFAGEGPATARAAPSPRVSAHTAALSARAPTSQTVSTKRYHRPIKAPLPELNTATYLHYMSNTQPLLSACIAGRRRCNMSVWRDELLKRKIDPHAQFAHALYKEKNYASDRILPHPGASSARAATR